MISSSNIAKLDYYTDNVLLVTFHSGVTWRYIGVPPEVYVKLLMAPSVGSYFYHNVRSHYKGEKWKSKS